MIAVIALGWFVIIQTKNAKPREIQKHLELAQKKEEQQIYVDALAEYKAALELDPERIDVYQKVVLLDYKMGQFSEFETQANALLTKTPNSYEVLNTLLSYYDENGKQDKALALLKQLISSHRTMEQLRHSIRNGVEPIPMRTCILLPFPIFGMGMQ